MTDRREQDPRELAALRMAVEKEIANRNHLRAQIFANEGMATGTEAEVFEYLDVIRDDLKHFLADANVRSLSTKLFQFELVGLEESEEGRDLLEALLVSYVTEEPKFVGLPDDDSLHVNDLLSVLRTRAMIFRKLTDEDPVESYAQRIATGLIPDYTRHGLEIPQNIRQVVDQDEIDEIGQNFDELRDDSQIENQQEYEALRKQFGIRDETFNDRVRNMELNEQEKQALIQLAELVPDLLAFASAVLNGNDGKMTI